MPSTWGGITEKLRLLMQEKSEVIYVVTEFAEKEMNSTGYLWSIFIEEAEKLGSPVEVISPGAQFANLPKTLRKFVASLVLFCLCLWKIPRGAKVLCGTNPASLPLIMSAIKIIKQIQLFVLVHDLFPDNAIPAGFLNSNSAIFRIASKLFEKAYRSSTGIVVIGRDMRKRLDSKVSGSVPILYVPNWVPTSKSASEIEPSKGKDIVVFQYFGNLGRLQGLEYVLDGISLSTAKNARFDFYGSGSIAKVLNSHPALATDSRVCLYSSVPFVDRNRILQRCDVSLVTLRPGMYGLGVPSKAYFSVANYKPIVVMGDKGSELELSIQEHPGIGWFVPAGHPQAFADCIDRICKLDSFLSAKSGCRDFLVEVHPRTAIPKLLAFVQNT
ncbi:glycosyltransferase family 4 protein [Sulfitobacter sp. 1A13679]|uniref:glycosyltransferase family 4 protein n=1 Tax=Sulfitobacter sp. 1A13679 TaxID=3368597 RepID=UPI003744F54E